MAGINQPLTEKEQGKEEGMQTSACRVWIKTVKDEEWICMVKKD